MTARTSDERASVYVLKMGQPVRIIELAERMIRLAGFEPGEEIEIAVTGTRAGERLHEILFAREEPRAEIGIDGVMAAKPVFADRERVDEWLEILRRAVAANDRAGSRARVRGSNSGIQPPDEDSRARRASPSRVELTGCQPRPINASGCATSEPATRSKASDSSRQHRAEAQHERRHRDEARFAPEPGPQRADDVGDIQRLRIGDDERTPQRSRRAQHRVDRRGEIVEGEQRPLGLQRRRRAAARAIARGAASAAMLPFTPGP